MNNVLQGEVLAGRYRLLEVLGRGAMGAVYKAVDLRLDRVVAIKVVRSQDASDAAPRPVTDEAKTQSRLHHPNVVTVFDAGEANGYEYLVTEFIEGRSLAGIIREGKPLDVASAVEIVAQIGQALGYMHRHGLAHRDVKPANILVCESGRAVLLDFGLATPVGDGTLEAQGTVHGTPRYMSPEQAQGLPLTGRSDIYSLAVVLYEALAGRSWSSRDPGSPAGMLRRIVEDPLAPIRQLNPEVPAAVHEILEKALAKDPDARYASADAFVRALLSAQPPRSDRAPIEGAPLRHESQPPGAPFAAGRAGEDASPDDLAATAAVAAYSPDASPRLHELAALWDELTRAAGIDKDRFVAAARTLARDVLREAVGYRIEQPIPYLKGTVGDVVEAPFLWIRHSRFPILFVAYDGRNSELLATVVQQLEIAKATEYFALLIVVPPRGKATGTEAAELNQLVADSVYRHDFVVLDRDHLFRLVAENTSRALIEIILEQRTELLAALSPYVISGPVPDNMFFGRESQLKMISQGISRSNFAVVGGRKIGKSSILMRLRRLFGDDARYRAIYIDCEARLDYENFFAALSEHVNVRVDAVPSSFQRMAAALRQGSPTRTVVFLLDEIDELLEFDADRHPRGPLLKAFRAASHEGTCRFVFSGGRTLYRHLRDGSSPFFNFCEATTLTRLQDNSIAEIVRKPMRQLGFAIPEDERLVTRLIELTSSHPNLAQWMCDRLIKTSVGKCITVDVLEQVAATPEFQEHYVSTAWGDATPLEKLITLLMAGPVFTDADVREKLAAHDIPADPRRVRESLDILCLSSLLDRDDASYRFGLARFPRIVRQSGVAPAQIDWLADEVRSRCS
jgi:predicted Ser/Thr protein kinase